VSTGDVTLAEASALLFREAHLLDTLRLEEWLGLFTQDALYWIPINEHEPPSRTAAIVYDDALRREERVDHLLHMPFPAQRPRSRTVHVIANVLFDEAASPSGEVLVRSNQVIYETRLGDHTQVGLGELAVNVASVEHRVRRVDETLRIAGKKILLINREMPQGNLTYLL